MSRRIQQLQFRLTALALVVGLTAVCGGCGAGPSNVEAFQLLRTTPIAGKPYRVAPPDTLRISSSVAPEIGSGGVTVSPDGTVMLPLLGSVHVSGKTTDEIAESLRQMLREYYHDADVSVNVASFRSKYVYVFGEVRAAGRFPYTGENSVLELLAAAQPTRAADPKYIQILRPRGDGETADRLTINLTKWVQQGKTDRNALLEDGDIVYVPANAFAEVGYAIQNLLRPVTPAASTLQGTTSIDTNVQTLSGP